MHASSPQTAERKDCNQLGLDLRGEAGRFAYTGPLWDVHTHIFSVAAGRVFFEAAEAYGIERVWTMTQLENVDALQAAFGDRLEFIAVPNIAARDQPGTFTTDWQRRIEQFREKGARLCKFWAAPRSFDFHPGPWLSSPQRREAMKLARELGMMFMTHVADPDNWFATKYADSSFYGQKRDHYVALERVLDEFDDVTWIAAHMGGWPENLAFLNELLDRHPNLYLDTSATKWMTRELSKHPAEFADFAARHRDRLLFGSDNVATDENADFDLFASRYWALRTLIETDYDGQNPIVDPDLHMVDPSLPEKSTAALRGAGISGGLLRAIYHDNAQRLLG